MHVHYIDWYVTPYRADRWLEIWRPALDRALAFGARASYLTRDEENPQHFRQVSTWEDPADFDRYWGSDEIGALREAALSYYHKPLGTVWHTLTADAAGTAPPASSAQRP
jgi:quinol monooxygenase YgiN